GLVVIAVTLSELIGAGALVFDGRGEPLARRTFRRELEPAALTAIAGELHERARNGDGRAFAPHHPDVAGRALALPVADAPEARRRAAQAWLVAVKDAGGLSDFDRLLLHHAVTVVALELLRGRVADTTERRLAGDVLSEIIGGALSGPELARRLEPFGLRGRVTALVFEAGEQPVE